MIPWKWIIFYQGNWYWFSTACQIVTDWKFDQGNVFVAFDWCKWFWLTGGNFTNYGIPFHALPPAWISWRLDWQIFCINWANFSIFGRVRLYQNLCSDCLLPCQSYLQSIFHCTHVKPSYVKIVFHNQIENTFIFVCMIPSYQQFRWCCSPRGHIPS